MAIKTASRQNGDIEGIIAEINQEAVKVVIYFFSMEFEKNEVQKALKRAFPQAACIGSSMIGGWSTKGAVERGITAMSLSSGEVAEVYTAFREGVKIDPALTARSAIDDLKRKTASRNINPDEYLGLIFFDGLCLGEIIMKEFTLEQDLNLPFIGGAAADELAFAKTLVALDDRISGDGLAVMIMKMKIPFYFSHYVHYIPTSTSFTVTRSENAKRVVWEIDGQSAAEYYARQTGVKDASKLNAGVFSKNPLGVKIGESVYVRSPNAVIDGRGLQFYCYIEAGTRVYLLRQGDIIADADNSLRDAAQYLPVHAATGSGIQGALLFNCVLRYLELRELRKVDAFNQVFSRQNFIGFNTFGEELFTHHNQTLTAVFFGAPPEPGVIDPYKTKRLFHYADSKLKSLIFEIISRSELLNVTISCLDKSFAPISDYMKQRTRAFKQSTGDFLSSFTKNQGDIDSIDKGFTVITTEFGDSFSLTKMLQESAKAVSENLSAIDDVTEITNILALNATIEAARAGAAGKGFAVVAAEIRKHATTTKDAVEDISKNITVLLKTIGNLSKKMDAVKTEVDQAKQMVDNLVSANKYEISLINSVNQEISALETTFNEYDVIKDALNTMIGQSTVSKEDIEKMLIVYQHNVKETGEIG
jgi:prefoldin subunit 5